MEKIKYLSNQQLDVLTELINIGVGKSSSSLNTLIDQHISLNVPSVELMHYRDFLKYLDNFKNENYASVTLPFKGDLIGNIKFLLSSSSAANLADSFMGEDFDDEDLDSIRSGVLNEVGNIVTNAVMGSVSNMLDVEISYIVPYFEEGTMSRVIQKGLDIEDGVILFAKADFTIDKIEVSGSFAIFFEMNTFRSLIEKIDQMM